MTGTAPNPFVIEVCPGTTREAIQRKLNGDTEYVQCWMQFIVLPSFTIYLHPSQGHDGMLVDIGEDASFDCMCMGQLSPKKEGNWPILYRCRGTLHEHDNAYQLKAFLEQKLIDFINEIWAGESEEVAL